MAVADMGVAMKVVTITGMVCMGIGQGVQLLLGYRVGAKLRERFKKALCFSLVFSLALGVALTIICYLFVNPIVGAFLTDASAYSYAVQFSCILPALFLLQAAIGITGLVWAQPVADILSIGLALFLYGRVSRKMMLESE